ncbi:MAG: adenosylmethionine decarboxylase [Rhodospirillales bacterium]|nr:adenosylmethionine decarboxylase [Rhodospirillales bacterium]|tara:strand:+ start:822 stop:1262 length:441 start_codon:yes stop_codon:yes gene_type:complete
MDQRSAISGMSVRSKKIEDFNDSKDFFSKRDGKKFAGTHILLDLWDAQNIDDQIFVEKTLKEAVKACEAKLLHMHLHKFGEGLGISGVAVLAESHISIHTWPERQFAAIDIFMCGNCTPENSLPIFQTYFTPKNMRTIVELRGVID